MTAVWGAITLFWGRREIPLLSQPIITSLNISRENNVKFGLKEQSIQEAEEIALKETWLTYENNYSWTDKQQNPDAERNTSDSNWLLPSENRTRRKHYSAHAALLFSALFARVHKKTRFFSYQIPARLTKHFASKKKKLKSVQRCVFVKCTHCSSFCLFSQFTSMRCTCNSQMKKTFYYRVLFQDCVSVVAFVC